MKVGSKTENIGIAKTKFDRFLRKNTWKSLLLAMTIIASTNNVVSAATFMLLVMDMRGNGAGIEKVLVRKGQKS